MIQLVFLNPGFSSVKQEKVTGMLVIVNVATGLLLFNILLFLKTFLL